MKTGLLILCVLASECFAHDFWMEPSDLQIKAESSIGVSLKLGDSFAKASDVPRSASHLDKFRIWHGDGTSEDIVGLANEIPAGIAKFVEDGDYMIGYQSKPQTVRLDGVTFEKYLLHEGYVNLIEERHRNGRASETVLETFVRCAKMAVRVGEGGDTMARSVGMPFEIVPATYPDADGKLEIQVLYHGEPVPDILVAARCRGGDEREQLLRTDWRGVAVFNVSDPGFWMVRCTLIELSPKTEGETHSYWASYSFSK